MGQTFRLKFNPDQELRYTLNSKSSQKVTQDGKPMGEDQGGFEATLTQKVLKSEADGSGHVVSVTVPNPGPGVPDNARNVIYQHLGSRGDVLEVSGQQQGNAFAFPEGEVDTGATWEGTTQTPIPNVPDPVNMRYVYKYEGDESLGGRHCARISFTSEPVEFQVPLPDGKGASQVRTASDGVMWFDGNAGVLVKLSLSTRTQPQVGPMAFDIENQTTQELVS